MGLSLPLSLVQLTPLKLDLLNNPPFPSIYIKATYIVVFKPPWPLVLCTAGVSPHEESNSSTPHLPQVANSSLGILVSHASPHPFHIQPTSNLSQKTWCDFGLVLERLSQSLPLEEGSSDHYFWFISSLLCPFKTPSFLQWGVYLYFFGASATFWDWHLLPGTHPGCVRWCLPSQLGSALLPYPDSIYFNVQ